MLHLIELDVLLLCGSIGGSWKWCYIWRSLSAVVCTSDICRTNLPGSYKQSFLEWISTVLQGMQQFIVWSVIW